MLCRRRGTKLQYLGDASANYNGKQKYGVAENVIVDILFRCFEIDCHGATKEVHRYN
jgi:hypothetical protein